MPHPFDLMCKHHPDREVDAEGRTDRFCRECVAAAWNLGAIQAAATWHQQPSIRYQDEQSTDGRNIYDSMRADNKSKYGATFK